MSSSVRRWVFVLPLLVAMGSGVVPAVSAEAPPPPGTGSERRLHLASAEASSFLVNDWNKFQENYLPLYVADGDPKTAWTDGIKGEGVGEWLRFKVSPMKGATRVRLRVRNGYQKSSKLFAANARAKDVTVVLLPSGTATDVTLADREDWQEVIAAQASGALEAIELRFKSVYPGKKYDDLCISDVEILVTATTPDNPAFEKSRLAGILKWKSERLAAARVFKTGAARSLPVAAQYRADATEEAISGNPAAEATALAHAACDKRERDERYLCDVRVSLERAAKDADIAKTHAAVLARTVASLRDAKAAGARLRPVQPVAQDRRPLPAVDGLCRPSLNECDGPTCYRTLPLPAPGTVGFLDRAGFSALDVKEAPALADVMARKLKECKRTGGETTWAWALDGAPGADGRAPIQALLLARCGSVESREGWMPAADLQLLVYGDDGKLQITAGPAYAAVLRWRDGASGPILAGGVSLATGERAVIQEAVNVANR